MKHLKNKDIIKEMYEVVLNRKEEESSREYINKEYLPKFNDTNKTLFKAFPDITFEIEEIYGEDNSIVTFYNWKGMHKNDYKNVSATGRNIRVKGVSVYVLEDGKIIDSRAMPDKFMFFEQLGVIPDDFIKNKS